MTENAKILIKYGFVLSKKQPSKYSQSSEIELYEKSSCYVSTTLNDTEVFSIHVQENAPIGIYWFEGSQLLEHILHCL